MDNPGTPWSKKNQGRHVSLGRARVTYEDLSGPHSPYFSAAPGSFGTSTSSPYQGFQDRKVLNRYEDFVLQPEESLVYAGSRFWYSKKRTRAVSWNNNTLFYRGRFVTFASEIKAACWVKAPITSGGTPRRLLGVLFKPSSGSWVLTYYSYARNLSLADRWLATVVKTKTLTMPFATGADTYAEFMANGVEAIIRIGLEDPQRVYRLAYNLIPNTETFTLLFSVPQHVISYINDGTSDGVEPPPPFVLDQTWTLDTTSTQTGEVDQQGGNIVGSCVFKNKYYYYVYRKVVSGSTSGSYSETKTYRYAGSAWVLHSASASGSAASTSLTQLWVGRYDLEMSTNTLEFLQVDSATTTVSDSGTKGYSPGTPSGFYTKSTYSVGFYLAGLSPVGPTLVVIRGDSDETDTVSTSLSSADRTHVFVSDQDYRIYQATSESLLDTFGATESSSGSDDLTGVDPTIIYRDTPTGGTAIIAPAQAGGYPAGFSAENQKLLCCRGFNQEKPFFYVIDLGNISRQDSENYPGTAHDSGLNLSVT